jgi:hypothetical protein
MKTTSFRTRKSGYVSVMLVISTGTILSVLTIFAYRRATAAQSVQAQVQLRVDYSEKEEAILRGIVALAPNRAIRAMQSGSNASDAVRNPLRWQNIFTESLVLANARTSISTDLVNTINLPGMKVGNSGDTASTSPSEIFKAIPSETGYVSAGINRSLGTGYPVPLTSTDNTTNTRDRLYPIISAKKTYGSSAQSGVGLPVGTYSNFNLLKYPQINFGYAKPGEDFVAKRNWWAFSVDVGDNDDDKTYLARNKRNFVFSIYEVPSQLPISASSFMSLGEYASGDAWQNVKIDGGIFAGKAEVEGETAISSLSSRRGMTLSSDSTVGGQSFTNNPFTPGVREAYLATVGEFFPVSLASESGRAAFIPINRGAEFFDRFSHTAESDSVSTTAWNEYSIGALQCAMRLDITKVQGGSPVNPTPTEIRFQYYRNDGTRGTDTVQMGNGVTTTLPQGYVKVCNENQSYTFTTAVDVAYGDPDRGGGFTFRRGVTGTINFNNATFGDPNVGEVKSGYWRPLSPITMKPTPGGQNCITVSPQRIPAYLASLNDNAAPVGPTTVVGPFGNSGPNASPAPPYYNNSIAVNVDYSNLGSTYPTKPNIPCTSSDYGVILQDCSDLTAYKRGFSLVTNLRLYIGDDFNTVPATPPTGYTPAITESNPTGRYMPPCSLFAPEKRYGVDVDPFAVNLGGQIGSLSKVDKVNAVDAEAAKVRPLDSKTMSGTAINAENITVNLSQIRHPAELPPISMMNWLVLLEERRKEFN